MQRIQAPRTLFLRGVVFLSVGALVVASQTGLAATGRTKVDPVRAPSHAIQAGLAPTERGATDPAFSASVSRLPPGLIATMKGRSWRAGCPVGLGDLRLVRARHWGFDGRVRQGRLVVHRSVAGDMVTVLRRLYVARFPIRRMVPVDAYGADDFRSIEADNTSAFNCRKVAGSTRWSNHAYGTAIDVNPIENPYVTSAGRTSHKASEPYVSRAPVRPGMAVEGGALVAAFDSVDWDWGGRWTGDLDYQHFSASGG